MKKPQSAYGLWFFCVLGYFCDVLWTVSIIIRIQILNQSFPPLATR